MTWGCRCFFILLLSGIAALPNTNEAAGSGRKLRVLTTFLPIYCFTANVAGEIAEVENLLPGNVSPHDYQFSRKDLEKLDRADLMVVNGLGLESWLGRLLKSTGNAKKTTV